jgi:hypothetical protein
MLGDVPIIAVNGAAGEVKAFALFTQHPREQPRWIKQQRKFHDDFTTHAAGTAHLKNNLGHHVRCPWVQYWWEGVASGGTSGWGARRLAHFMGFDRVALCGIPMDKGKYVYRAMIGRAWQSDDTIEHYRKQIEADSEMHDGVISFSGWTREFFGDG